VLGSARVSRAGFGAPAKTPFCIRSHRHVHAGEGTGISTRGRVRSAERWRRVIFIYEMNTESNTVPELPVSSGVTDPGYNAEKTRPMYWSVRRELWENRSIYIAPLIVAAVQVFGFAISIIGLAERRRAVSLLDPAKQRAHIEQPYDIAAMMMIFTVFIVGVFYCLDALHGERRDRSILFWKSLPVSDFTTVLSKATIPLAVLPLLAFAITVCVQVVMLLMTSAVLIVHGVSPATTWIHFPVFQNWLVLLYGLVALALWHAPIYGWLLLVSGWARRATFLWAVLPLLAISVLEKIAFNSSHFASMLKDRLMSWAAEAFAFNAHGNIDSLAQLTPGKFLSTPGLWIGLAFAAAFLFAAVRLRRYRGPI
jgi:ABC-2 type transport system permease protein